MALLTSPAAADKEAKVKELIQLSSGNFNQIEQVLSKVFEPAMMNIKCAYTMTDMEATEIQRKFMDLLDLKNTVDAYIPFYTTHFTEEEIDEILKFQKSTAGQKMVTLQPQLAQFMLQQQQKVMISYASSFNCLHLSP